MVQRYSFLLLFIIILINFSCQQETNKNNMKTEKIKIGDKAPVFTLPDKDGKPVNLSDFIGRTAVILFFYPKDESYGCTKEACSFRDNYEDFKESGAEVIGISADDAESHRKFAVNHKLPFILLSDKDKSVATLYGAGNSLGILPGRVTFVIDKQGIVRMAYSSQVNFKKHVEEAIEMVKKLH